MPRAALLELRALLGLVTLSLAAAVLPACAFTDVDHLAVTNWADRTLVPDNRAAQWALVPLYPVASVLTLAADNLVVAPIVHLPSAAADTGDWLEKDIGGYFTELGLLPLRLGLTPVVFLGDWFVRSFFGADPREDADWGWPAWGEQWVRGRDGKLLGPPARFDPVTKKPRPRPPAPPRAQEGRP